MGYIYLFCVALLFSFNGICSKNINPYFSPQFIAMFRMTGGVVYLILLKVLLRQGFGKDYKKILKMCFIWLAFGAFAKWVSYVFENTGLTLGPSYGSIVTQPSQTVFLTIASIVLFKEKLSVQKIICIILCMAGVMVISWNGKPLDEAVSKSGIFTICFVIAGFLAGCHVLAQKKVAGRMDIVDSNLTIFAIASIFSFIPVVPQIQAGALIGVVPSIACLISIAVLGFNTGIGFYLNAKAIPLVPFYMVPVIQSSMVIFTIIWGALFFHEEVTVYVIAGTLIFMCGLLGLQLLNAKK